MPPARIARAELLSPSPASSLGTQPPLRLSLIRKAAKGSPPPSIFPALMSPRTVGPHPSSARSPKAGSLASLRQPPSTLVVASATGIYGDQGDEVLDESSAPGSGFLADLCRQWEAAAQPAVDAGIRVVHARFGVVLGPGAGALSKMLPLFRLGLGGRLGSGKQWMSWISLSDVVAAILFILETPSLTGPINVCSQIPVTNSQFTHAVAQAVHRPAILPAPAFALRLALGEMADEALLASARVIPARLNEAGFQFTHPTIDQALSAALALAHPALS
jgi:uncharacterized protein